MICCGYMCETCRHKKGKKDGWDPTCDAFPNGNKPDEICFAAYKDRDKWKVCNNGIGYEADVERVEYDRKCGII